MQQPAAEPAGVLPEAQRPQSMRCQSQPRSRAHRLLPMACRVTLAASDMVMLLSAAAISIYLRYLFNPLLEIEPYAALWPAAFLFLFAFAITRLYVLVGLSPAEELRRGTWAITMVYLALAAATFMFRGGEVYSRATFLLAWCFSLVLIPLGRAVLRNTLGARPWWGHPVIVLGAGETGKLVICALRRQPWIGLHPVAAFDDDPGKAGPIEGVPVVGRLEQAISYAGTGGVSYAILAMPGVPHQKLLQIVERHAHSFSRLILVPDLFGFASLRTPTVDLGGVLGLEMRQLLLLPLPRFMKRSFDLVTSALVGLLTLPLLLMVALLIKIESPGPVLYTHLRIGRQGRRFRVWKFRTMVPNAESVLARYLSGHPELRAEWEHSHKLKNDPRVTRLGRFLRKASLDELPQLWNVIRGEMSLVGPRPIVEGEIERYHEAYETYLKVRPGITGLWQVSGRSDTTYAERVALGTYYVRNWSLWQDIVILGQTVLTVLGKGAY